MKIPDRIIRWVFKPVVFAVSLGPFAWLVWAAVHLEFLAESSLRVSVFLQWVWTYLTGRRGSRLIVNYHGSNPQKAQADAAGGTRVAVGTPR